MDILQIPAFLCRQTDLLVAAAKTPAIINIKRINFSSRCYMKHPVEKILNTRGNNMLSVIFSVQIPSTGETTGRKFIFVQLWQKAAATVGGGWSLKHT